MTLDILTDRLAELNKIKSHLEQQFTNAQTSLLIIQGSINECQFHLQNLSLAHSIADEVMSDEPDEQPSQTELDY